MGRGAPGAVRPQRASCSWSKPPSWWCCRCRSTQGGAVTLQRASHNRLRRLWYPCGVRARRRSRTNDLRGGRGPSFASACVCRQRAADRQRWEADFRTEVAELLALVRGNGGQQTARRCLDRRRKRLRAFLRVGWGRMGESPGSSRRRRRRAEAEAGGAATAVLEFRRLGSSRLSDRDAPAPG
jgi:hypothetical protein